jgi:hypothetical protein
MASRLVLWENSFQTLDQSLEVVADRIDCVGFEAAEWDRQESALIQSFHALNPVLFVVEEISTSDVFSMAMLDADERALLPANFLYALRMAQVLNADGLLGGDSTSEAGRAINKRKAGILEERIGESFQRYERYGRLASELVTTNSQLDARALSALSPWRVQAVRVARA